MRCIYFFPREEEHLRSDVGIWASLKHRRLLGAAVFSSMESPLLHSAVPTDVWGLEAAIRLVSLLIVPEPSFHLLHFIFLPSPR